MNKNYSMSEQKLQQVIDPERLTLPISSDILSCIESHERFVSDRQMHHGCSIGFVPFIEIGGIFETERIGRSRISERNFK